MASDTQQGASADSDAAPRTGGVWALIVGGGTAGHVSPGIAVARALVARGHPAESLHFVGSARGVEARLVPQAGFTLTALPGRGIQRKVAFENVAAIAGLLVAFVQAFGIVARHRPKVVLALGGYASVPCALAAALWRIPVVVAEQNAVPGLANRVVARLAEASAVSFPDTPLPRATVTGNPVRPEVLAVDRDRDRPAARARIGLEPGRMVVLVWGGSLGALRINEAVIGALNQWRDRRDLAVRHIVGARDWDQIGADRRDLPAEGLQYQPVRYDDDMATSLAAADLSVSRSGSSACFELATVGLPGVLVPSPYVTADHQTANAHRMAAAGAAVVVPDAELDAARLVSEVDRLIADPAALAGMGKAAAAAAVPDAADRIAALVEAHARA